MSLKKIDLGKKINKPYILTQLPIGSVVINAKKTRILEKIEKLEKSKLK